MAGCRQRVGLLRRSRRLRPKLLGRRHLGAIVCTASGYLDRDRAEEGDRATGATSAFRFTTVNREAPYGRQTAVPRCIPEVILLVVTLERGRHHG